jgi:hypothetical protein
MTLERPRPHPLRQYSLVADGERGALIGPDGAWVWLCFPRWHDPSVFASLIGGEGFYRVVPHEPFTWGGYYEPGSLVWRSRWVSTVGVVECREALAMPAPVGRAVLLRRVKVLEGRGRLDVDLHLRGGYGGEPLRSIHRGEDGSWTGECDGMHVRWSGAPSVRVDPDGQGGRRLSFHLDLEHAEQHDLVLELGTRDLDDEVPDADRLWASTEQHWNETVPHLHGIVARRDARHAYAVLAGLTSTGGGTVAAATCALPERAEAGRSYDYRYVWIRDQCLAGLAVAALGSHPLLDDAVCFVAARLLEDGARLRPAYTTDGGRVPDERALGLPGYPGGADIVGNHVNGQFQLDAFGEALLLFAAAARHDHLDADGWRAAEVAAAAIEERRREPDAGIWEVEDRTWTHSRLECVAGLRAAAAAPGAPRSAVARWMAVADGILAETARSSVHRDGRWQRAPDDERVDAALLVPALRGAVPADDPRTVATLAAVRAELADDQHLYRFAHDDGPLERAEGAFLLCGFWMSMAYLQQGEVTEAMRWFERNRAACGPPGLFAEEYDVVVRQLRGNLPQAFVHAGMLETACRLSAVAE